ncbi:GGDEF/EAL domain-containing response regulator [Alkalisalibacterium limincola]|nr:EAL domain-containing response regulator [Alkalisalibacterium limincola]
MPRHRPPPPSDNGNRAAAEPVDTPRVYHLTDGSGLGCEIDQAMEGAGWEIEVLADAEELQELLAALPPNLVVIDAAFVEGLEEIGAVLRATRQRTGVRIPLAAIVEVDELTTRLSARRAGVDSLLIDPPGVEPVLEALRALLAPSSESPFRVLIVEDDASQALFAESILRNASMETEVVDDPFDVLPALERFAPDMVLMDLHMPGCNGMELTSLIRDDERFLNLPIVFLSGEADQDVQFEALDAGGDDFIAKPVRPRHLISAVQNRVRRARALAQREHTGTIPAPAPGAPTTGLTDRGNLMAQAQSRLEAARTQPANAGGMLFLEVEGGAQLRDRLGLSTLEQLLSQAAIVIETRLGPKALICRFGDASFLALAPDGTDDALLQTGQAVRHALSAYAFEANDRPLRLRFSVGAASLAHEFDDAGELLNAAERCCRKARGSERGVEVFQPEQNPDAAREAALLQRIRDGIDGQGFELVFQPIVAVQGGDDAQYQTLLRMREPDGRLMPAGELIPVAMRANLMLAVDRWVVDTALEMLRDAAHANRQTRLFVPQAIDTLREDGQAAWLVDRLAAAGVPGSALVLELRADDVVVHQQSIDALCHTLSDAGVGLCLARFELGEQTRTLLERLPLAYVKLGSKYLEANSAQDVRDELRVLIDEAHRHNLQVIGHRVEDAQSAATLWMSGIDFIQGNLVQRADAATTFDFQSAVL